jgi:hypothetical protein
MLFSVSTHPCRPSGGRQSSLGWSSGKVKGISIEHAGAARFAAVVMTHSWMATPPLRIGVP